MTEIEPRTARHEIAGRQYEGTDSLTGAFADRQRMSAAVEAAKRARVDATQWMWNAREAERTLGRMILAARDAGELAGQGQRGPQKTSDDTRSFVTLDDLGISYDLATLATKLAKLPDDAWESWHQDAEPTQTKVASAATEYLACVEAQKSRMRMAEEEADEAKRAAAEARKRVDKLKTARPSVPPLREEETSIAGAEMALDAAVGSGEAQGPTVDNSPAVREQTQLLAAMGSLAKRIEAHDPLVTTDAFRDANVMAGRDAVRRLVDAATVWLRTLNTLYSEETR